MAVAGAQVPNRYDEMEGWVSFLNCFGGTVQGLSAMPSWPSSDSGDSGPASLCSESMWTLSWISQPRTNMRQSMSSDCQRSSKPLPQTVP